MQTIQITGDNTKVIIDNEGITIEGENIRITEVTEEQPNKDLLEFFDECRECIDKCKKCSGGFNAEKFIAELRDNVEFQNIVKEVTLNSLFNGRGSVTRW